MMTHTQVQAHQIIHNSEAQTLFSSTTCVDLKPQTVVYRGITQGPYPRFVGLSVLHVLDEAAAGFRPDHLFIKTQFSAWLIVLMERYRQGIK